MKNFITNQYSEYKKLTVILVDIKSKMTSLYVKGRINYR